MIGYLKEHESWAKKVIESHDADLDEAVSYHCSVISFLEWERIAHCIVMLAVGLGSLIATVFSVTSASPFLATAALILLIVFSFYIRHYFLLENGIQRLYILHLKMEKRRGRVSLL